MGVCTAALNFTTARGYRLSNPPAGYACAFNYFSYPDCEGPYVSTGTLTDGSGDWPECVRNFVDRDGDPAGYGLSFIFVCFGVV